MASAKSLHFLNSEQVSFGGGGTAPTTISGAFTHTLKPGIHDPEVTLLQQLLNTHGFTLATTGPGSLGNETDFFGTLTTAALVKFQEAHMAEILNPLGLTRGTGNFGIMTMKVVNSIILGEK